MHPLHAMAILGRYPNSAAHEPPKRRRPARGGGTWEGSAGRVILHILHQSEREGGLGQREGRRRGRGPDRMCLSMLSAPMKSVRFPRSGPAVATEVEGSARERVGIFIGTLIV